MRPATFLALLVGLLLGSFLQSGNAARGDTFRAVAFYLKGDRQ